MRRVLEYHGITGVLARCAAIQRSVDPMLVVVIAEGFELPREVDAVPEERAIQEFAPDGTDQSLNVGMRDTGSLFHPRALN